MVKDYWTLFYTYLIAAIILFILIVIGLVFRKKIFTNKKNRLIQLILFTCIALIGIAFSVREFVLCCKDYEYVSNNTYIETKAQVVEFTVSRIDYDGDGKRHNSQPKFYLIEKDEYVVLYVKDVEVGETYLIRYYPNTKICDVIEKIS